MEMIKSLLVAASVAGLMSLSAGQAIAQVDVRYSEAPNYQSTACPKAKGSKLRYEKPHSSADQGYRALFGVWCGVNKGDNVDFLMAVSEDSVAFSGQEAQTVKMTIETDKGFQNSFGVVFFDTRQKRWSIALSKGETWVLWPENGGRVGMARGRFNGKTVRMHKGRKQTWVLMNRVR